MSFIEIGAVRAVLYLRPKIISALRTFAEQLVTFGVQMSAHGAVSVCEVRGKGRRKAGPSSAPTSHYICVCSVTFRQHSTSAFELLTCSQTPVTYIRRHDVRGARQN